MTLRSRRKTFTVGQAVEVQREVGRRTWEPATYLHAGAPARSRSGYHWVKLPPVVAPMYVDPVSGERQNEPGAAGRRIATWNLLVPSARIRESKMKTLGGD